MAPPLGQRESTSQLVLHSQVGKSWQREGEVDKVVLGDPHTGIRPGARGQREDEGCGCSQWPSAMYSRCHTVAPAASRQARL